MKTLDSKLLAILACPVCRGKVDEIGGFVVCQRCGRRYPIRGGIPIMLPDQAEQGDSSAQGGDQAGG